MRLAWRGYSKVVSERDFGSDGDGWKDYRPSGNFGRFDKALTLCLLLLFFTILLFTYLARLGPCGRHGNLYPNIQIVGFL